MLSGYPFDEAMFPHIPHEHLIDIKIIFVKI